MASLTTILSVKQTLRLALVATLVSVACVSAQAQDAFLDFRSQVRPSAGKTPGLAQQASKGTLAKGDAKMLVRADEMSYDNANASIAAIGNVQIYYAERRSRPTKSFTTRRPSDCTPKAMRG